VQESLRRAGVRHMEILIHGRRLVMILELDNGRDPRRVFADHAESHPRVQEWERMMRVAPGARLRRLAGRVVGG